ASGATGTDRVGSAGVRRVSRRRTIADVYPVMTYRRAPSHRSGRKHPAREFDRLATTVRDERRAAHDRGLVRGQEQAAIRHLVGGPCATQGHVRGGEVVGLLTT